MKKSKNLLVLTGSKLKIQVEDSEATSFVHNLVITMTTFTDEQLLNLDPQQVNSLNTEQMQRRKILLENGMRGKVVAEKSIHIIQPSLNPKDSKSIDG